MDHESDWTQVFSTHEQVEAELIRGLLETNGFPVIVEATGFKAQATFFGHAAVGQYLIKVPPDRVEEAQALLSAEVETQNEDQ